MDIILLLVLVFAVVSVAGWGYGTYGRTAVVDGPASAAPVWVNPMGILGLILVVGFFLMLATGWRPFVVAPLW